MTWDEKPEMIVRAEPLRVRSASALPIVDPSLPFSVLDAAAAPQTAYGNNGRQRALPTGDGDTTYIELPPAKPVRGALPRDVTATRPRHDQNGGRPDVTLSLSKGEPQPTTEPYGRRPRCT